MTLFGMVIEVSEVLLNAALPIDFSTLSASKVTEVSALASWNAVSPIVMTPSGMVIEVSEVFLNAPLPIEVTLFGMVIEVRALTYQNALSPIEVTPFGITADPTQSVLPVSTLSVIVKVPPALQFTVAAHAGGATRVAPSRANTAVSDSLFAFNIIAPFL